MKKSKKRNPIRTPEFTGAGALAGRPAHASVEDILFTSGLIIGAIERDLGPITRVGASWVAPSSMRFPSAEEWWDRIVPRHVAGISVRIRPVHFETT